MKHICILTQSHLCRNPRVVKEANALHRAGYRVTILTTFTNEAQRLEDLTLIDEGIELRGVENIIPGQTGKWHNMKTRMVRRIASEMISRLKWENVESLGYGFHRNLRAAVAQKADLYTCHQEMATVIGCKLLKKGFRVAFDLEDWYSHDLLPSANRYRPLKLLSAHEKYALNHSPLVYTTSESMARGMQEFYGGKQAEVLYNVFPWAEREWLDGKYLDRINRDKPSIHWYSQTIGPGRGLEFLVGALNKVKTPVDLHLRGNCRPDYENKLRSILPAGKEHGLFIHPLVPHKELLSRIAEHDIGLALEEYTPDSRNLTITNKILQYLLAGLPVIASDTAGQQEVARLAPESVFLFGNKDENELAHNITLLLEDRGKLERSRKMALEYAKQTFCWEVQEKKLTGWIEKLI
ncbi:MAG: glycosyltransferase [Bacteroidetes bacterium]|nr:glycosyltransferase [Bacteroidota bacterium]